MNKKGSWGTALVLIAVIALVTAVIIGMSAQPPPQNNQTSPPPPMPPPDTPPPVAPPAISFSWNTAYAAQKISGGTIMLPNGADFNLETLIATTATITRVDYYIDGVKNTTETTAPYWIFGDFNTVIQKGKLSAGAHTVRAVAYAGTQVLGESTVSLVPSTTTTPPPPASVTNYLTNGDFATGISGWQFFSGSPYYTWEAGTLRLVPNTAGSTTSAFRGCTALINPGDKVVITAKAKAGPTGTPHYNNGASIGGDLRASTDPAFKVVYVIQGPATKNADFTTLRVEQTIPCLNHAKRAADVATVSSGASTTAGGSNVGAADMALIGQPLPATMSLTVWAQIWEKDSVQSANFDDITCGVVRDAVAC